uniref:tripartite motif-containing protein 16-like n=1 Tax=Monopterus albus TaxID=43700 RepID=UPI0009B47DDB|nr:tripartite motif-containing protein 16-like [Monopterus albus]
MAQQRNQCLQQEVEAISRSADKAVGHSEDVFTELIRLLEKRRSDVKQQIRSQQETEVSRVKELQQKLEQEITELKRKDAGLEQLSHTEDPTQFLLNYPSVSALSQSTGSTSANVSHQMYFEDVTAAVSEVRNNMVAVLSETWTQTEHKTRADFLQYLCQVTLDPNTANNYLVLSKGNRSITCNDKYKPYPEHPDRFSDVTQVLSKDGLTGRCYWEVEMSGYVTTAVAYKSISRSGDFNTDVFGYNDKSWVLHCSNCCTFIHNKISAPISGLPSCRLGVYLDHSAGVLCFYSVSPPRTMTLLHRVQTTFTEPLYAGLGICGLNGDTAELCELKHIDLQKQAMEKINNESLQ